MLFVYQFENEQLCAGDCFVCGFGSPRLFPSSFSIYLTFWVADRRLEMTAEGLRLCFGFLEKGGGGVTALCDPLAMHWSLGGAGAQSS